MTDAKPLPDDNDPADGPTEELTAYLDGELDARSAEAMATRLSLDAQLRAEADALQRAWDILDVLPRPQPSPAFTSRTVSQVISVPAGSSDQTLVLPGSAASTMSSRAARPAGTGFWMGALVLIVVAAAGGYLGHRALVPAPRSLTPEPPLEDVTLMKNLRLYRNVDDLDYLKKLDTPEYFGEESE